MTPTMNRPDFMIRQLEYYAKAKSPHPIYIGDASNEENSKKLQDAVKRLSKYLTINYSIREESGLVTDGHPMVEPNLELDGKIKEKYCVFSGDDDYQIPDSLTKCAEFLEENPDYSSASGHAIVFRLEDSGCYGKLDRIHNYPRYSIESPTASQRLIDFMAKYNVTLFSVQRTEDMKKCWSGAETMKDIGFANEILHCSMSSVLGKSKIINCLSLVRQLGNLKFVSRNVFEWITHKDFSSSYDIWRETLAREITVIDGISTEEARKVPPQAFWNYLNVTLPIEHKKIYHAQINDHKKYGKLLRKLRFQLGQNLPWLKTIYLRTAPSLPLYQKVVQPSSPYYKDFQPVLDSFTGKCRNSQLTP